MEAFGRHLWGIWEASGSQGDQGDGIWEASGSQGPGGPQGGARRICSQKVKKIIVLYSIRAHKGPFRVDETREGVTISAACAQKFWMVWRISRTIHRALINTTRTPTAKSCLRIIRRFCISAGASALFIKKSSIHLQPICQFAL